MSVRLSVELYIDDVWERQRGPERSCPGAGLHPAPMDKPGGDDHSVRADDELIRLAGVRRNRLVEATRGLLRCLPAGVSGVHVPFDPRASTRPKVVIERFVPADFVEARVAEYGLLVSVSEALQCLHGLELLAGQPKLLSEWEAGRQAPGGPSTGRGERP